MRSSAVVTTLAGAAWAWPQFLGGGQTSSVFPSLYPGLTGPVSLPYKSGSTGTGGIQPISSGGVRPSGSASYTKPSGTKGIFPSGNTSIGGSGTGVLPPPPTHTGILPPLPTGTGIFPSGHSGSGSAGTGTGGGSGGSPSTSVTPTTVTITSDVQSTITKTIPGSTTITSTISESFTPGTCFCILTVDSFFRPMFKRRCYSGINNILFLFSDHILGHHDHHRPYH